MRAGAIAASIAALAFVGSASGAATAHPQLQLVDRSPLAVRGIHFDARARVRVTITLGVTRYVRLTRTTAAGTFRVQVAAAAFDPCNDALFVVAHAATGDRAALKLPQRQCPVSP